jgi:lipoic acid synthetase
MSGPALRRHPPWLKVRLPAGPGYAATRALVRDLRLHTVCEEAACPNIGECWSHRTATFMLLGDTCTRNCSFCAVSHGRPAEVDAGEPERVADGVARLGLAHVVVTSVDRDDLPDGGASHFAATAWAVGRRSPATRVEVLVPDFQGRLASVETVVSAPVDVFNHNVETVPRLYKRVRPGARYERSLAVLEAAFDPAKRRVTKAGLMVGVGERWEEVSAVLRDLRGVGVSIVTIGQYLRPSASHLPIERHVRPDEFDTLRQEALALGFDHVEAGPLVRSSYHAWSHVGEIGGKS